ncbi:hypothetical protein Efla_002574 [Eimeria flavescens]
MRATDKEKNERLPTQTQRKKTASLLLLLLRLLLRILLLLLHICELAASSLFFCFILLLLPFYSGFLFSFPFILSFCFLCLPVREEESEELDTTLKDFYNADLAEEDAEDVDDFEPPCEEDDEEEEEEEEEEEGEEEEQDAPTGNGIQEEGGETAEPEAHKRKLQGGPPAEAAAAFKAAKHN